ncbi:MAG: class A beta-lactamase-related serine hydrolase, partial [Acidobacteriota bacterium]|nr:class A beta-lactamase-related serine hydrolase [Acidobacteriota bacterium]
MISKLSTLVVICSLSSFAGQSSGNGKLDAAVRTETAGFPGKITIYAENLENGTSYSLAGEQPVRTASTIKLAIMAECFAEAAEGKLQMAERIRLTDDEKVSGSGILQDLSSGDELPIRDMIDLMIVLSDNTATNLILTRIGGNAVNTRMASLGLTQTRVMRKILGDRNQLKPHPEGITDEGAKSENKIWGIGRSSPKEMVMLLEMIYRGKLVSKPASDEMLAILKRQRDHGSIGRDMKDVTIANKTGALDHLRSDVGILYSAHGAIALAITVDDIA